MKHSLRLLVVAVLLVSITHADAATVPSSTLLRPASLRINVQSDTPVMRDFTLGPTRFILSMQPGEERMVDVELTSREGESSIFW
jgi:hypothetical protein